MSLKAGRVENFRGRKGDGEEKDILDHVTRDSSVQVKEERGLLYKVEHGDLLDNKIG
jgi:hypothetical protein